MSKASIPKGTRDFSPREMVRRNFIFNTIKKSFELYGFLPIETPAMENLSTLTGKYGEEGDQLIFKILNNGDYLAKANMDAFEAKDSKKLSFSISKKALRYDLTVPFARFVVMNQGKISFPFRRYQIQPVWRGDRPGKGRYQEFFQCDVDVIGTDSLYCEVELVQIIDEVLTNLGLKDFTIKLNNRKILYGIAEVIGAADKLTDITVAIDKLDKIGVEKVVEELVNRGIDADAIEKIKPLFSLNGTNQEKMSEMRTMLAASETGLTGLDELQYVLDLSEKTRLNGAIPTFDITLARGLNYYTGAIFEVVAGGVSIGSISGGGRYDDLTGIFGLKGMSGVGVSFGADRIYDVMEELDLFPKETDTTTKILFINFGEEEAFYCMNVLKELRAKGISSELYPSPAKMKKQMKYAHDKEIPFVALVGSNEMESGVISLKNMESGEQSNISKDELYKHLS